MAMPNGLPTCKEYAEKVGFCCKDLFFAMRIVESQAEPNEGIGSCVNNAYGPYQIERLYHADAMKECGPKVPTEGGYGVPQIDGGSRVDPAQTFSFPSSNTGPNVPSVRYSKSLSEHVMCCYMKKWNPAAKDALKCCAELNGRSPIPHGHWSIQEFGPPPGEEPCTSKDLKALEAIARTHNGGYTMRWNDIDPATGVPKNWGATTGKMGKRAKNTKIYWEKVCREFGAKDREHPNALEICKCT